MAFRNNNSARKVQSSSKGSSHYSGGYQRGGANDIEEQKRDYEQYLSKPIRERRKVYSCGKRFVPLSSVPTWGELYAKALSENPGKRHQMGTFAEADEYINGKVSVWKGDITTLEIDAIVNAANERLLGGGGVDGAIHRAAGSRLYKECKTLHGCATGGAKITYGYDLPASYVIHTVGPQYEDENLLRACYVNSLNLMLTKKLRTIAFPCISTGIYGYPNVSAAKTAISTVRQFLEKKGGDVDRIIFCLFMPEDDRCYADFMPLFFPVGEEEC